MNPPPAASANVPRLVMCGQLLMAEEITSRSSKPNCPQPRLAIGSWKVVAAIGLIHLLLCGRALNELDTLANISTEALVGLDKELLLVVVC